MSVGLLILGLFLFIMLIVVHEFGHFFVARRNGVEIEEFGIFFPPTLWSHKTKEGWTFSINLIPLGGFVRLKGEHDSDTAKGSFGAASLGAKSRIMLAGVGMNLFTAFVLLTLLAWVGIPQLVNNQYTIKSNTKVEKNEVLISYVEPGSPAQKAGLVAGDELLALIPVHGPNVALTNANTLPNITKEFAGKTVGVEIVHNKQMETKQITFEKQEVVTASQKTNNPKGYLGVSPTQYSLSRSTWSAPIVAVGIIAQYTVLTLHGIGVAFKGLGSIIAALITNNHAAREAGQTNASSQVAGPIGIYAVLKDGTVLGYQFVLMVIAVISFTLALINVLPYPILDGGKLYMTLIARLFRKRLSETVEAWVYGVSILLIIPLFILISISDVHRFF